MGEACRALETKLGRDVALKVLPKAMADDAERMARFEQNNSNFLDVSPDGRHLALTTESVLEANIGMIENVR